jgi:hypothetical protein
MNLDGTFSLAVDSFESEMADAGISNDKDSMSNFCSNKFNGIMDTGPAFKFSNIFTSIITSYVLSTQEGWPDIMNSYRIYGDVNGIFFIVYNLIVAYFFLNLFTGIMFRYFNEAYSKEKTFAKDDKKAPKYYDFLTQIDKAQSNYSIWVRPEKGSIRYYLREFADSTFLDNFIMGCIVLNMISMAINYDTADSKYDLALTYVNYIFTGIFIVECLINWLNDEINIVEDISDIIKSIKWENVSLPKIFEFFIKYSSNFSSDDIEYIFSKSLLKILKKFIGNIESLSQEILKAMTITSNKINYISIFSENKKIKKFNLFELISQRRYFNSELNSNNR